MRTIDDVLHWPQLEERNMVERVWHPLSGSHVDASAAGFPLKFSRTPGGYERHAPLPGQHTEEVVARLANVAAPELRALRMEGVV